MYIVHSILWAKCEIFGNYCPVTLNPTWDLAGNPVRDVESLIYLGTSQKLILLLKLF